MKNNILTLLKTNNVFLTGGAGVGKSYFAKEIISYYKNNLLQVVALGSTGISAVGIGGQTIHSFFGFGICNCLEELILFDKKNRKKIKDLKEILKSCDLIVIDEISMVSSNLMDMMKYRLESLNFNGKILFVGDFFQLPPVIKKRNNSLFSNNIYAFESSAWEFFSPKTVELKEMKRTKDKKFFEILNKIRISKIDDKILDYLIGLSKNIEVKNANSTGLYGRNNEVYKINYQRLHEHNAKEIVLKASLQIHEKKISQNKLQNWINSLPVDEELKLKEGVPVLFTSNKWGKFFNGERGIIKEILNDSLMIEKNNRLIKVQRQDFNLIEYKSNKDGDIEENILASISQFPVKLAYAITIHKSQGMSIDNLLCNIDYIFTPSQFYVAISRATNPENLYLQYSKGDLREYLMKVIKISDKVKNFYDKL